MFPQREFSIKAFEPIFLDSYEFISKHVESIILMTYCGSGGEKQKLTTPYSGSRVILEQKMSEKTPFFDPYFWGALQMTQGKKSDDIIKVEKLMAQKEGEIILWDDKNFI